MTDLNNEVRELPIDEMTNDELDSVSGGFNLIATLRGILAEIKLRHTKPVMGTTLK